MNGEVMFYVNDREQLIADRNIVNSKNHANTDLTVILKLRNF